MSNYNIYKQARDCAWKFLIQNHICRLPLNLSEICRRNGIVLLRHSSFFDDEDRGLTYTRSGKFHIMVNGNDSLSVQRFTTAHELGHIFMNHPMTEGVYGRTFGVKRKPLSDIEYQAERFAADILAPACVLWAMNLHTASEIAEACCISHEDAVARAERMRILYKRNKFLVSPLEKQVFEQFRPYI